MCAWHFSRCNYSCYIWNFFLHHVFESMGMLMLFRWGRLWLRGPCRSKTSKNDVNTQSEVWALRSSWQIYETCPDRVSWKIFDLPRWTAVTSRFEGWLMLGLRPMSLKRRELKKKERHTWRNRIESWQDLSTYLLFLDQAQKIYLAAVRLYLA